MSGRRGNRRTLVSSPKSRRPDSLRPDQTGARVGTRAEPLERRVLLADTIGLLKDINDATVDPPAGRHDSARDGFTLQEMTAVNGKVFFTADRGPVGRELWVTDGTQAGTRLVKDIYPEGSSSIPVGLTDVDGTLFFFADDGVHGRELWKSDGTEAGTVMVKDILPGGASSVPWRGTPPTVYAAALPGVYLFTVAFNQRELWRSDGTEAGTYLLKTAETPSPGPFSDLQSFSPITASNGFGYFSVSDPTIGRELWRTDGTVAGTTLVADVMPGAASSYPQVIRSENGKTFFNARTGGDDQHLVYSGLVTDGTPGGTQLLLPGEQFASVQGYNGSYYFVPRKADGEATEVFRTDGTPQGTSKLIEFAPAPAVYYDRTSAAVRGIFRGKLLLSGFTPAGEWKFWVSDAVKGPQ